MAVLAIAWAFLAWHGGLTSCRAAAFPRPAYGVLDRPITYHGSLLGVSAELMLFRKSERAVVTLKGIPLGGSISGVARFQKDGFNVDLDEDLKVALKRRRVKIEGAGAFHDYSKVWVLIQLPLGLGRHTLSLDRQYS